MRQQPTPPYSRSRSTSTQPDEYAGEFVWTQRKLRELARSEPPPYHRSVDLPSSTQNIMNNLPRSHRLHDSARLLFEAYIEQQTALDEPSAPKIEFWNNVDDLEPCPPWEFHYSNSMWLGEGVKPPSYKDLKGCKCRGTCSENSTTCACLRKQTEHVPDGKGFRYNRSGQLKWVASYQETSLSFPIFECNQFCGCDDTCQNRVSRLSVLECS